MSARDEIKAWSGRDVVARASAMGLERAKDSRQHWICPRHGGGALSLTVGLDRSMQVRCFGCDLAGSVYDLAAEIMGLSLPGDFPAVHTYLAELAGVALDERARFERPAPRERVPQPPPVYPPEDEVDAMWHGAAPVTDNAAVAAYLASRALDPSLMWSRGLARVLTAKTPRFPWATFRGRSWFDAGYRLVVPVYDAIGAMRGLRAWSPEAKRIAPMGCNVRGLVMACSPFGVAMFEGAHRPDRVVIAEGEPDFLTWATHGALLDARRWVTLGIVSGAWTQEIADRIPEGAEVIVRTDADAQGEKYAQAIVQTLGTRAWVSRAALEHS